MAIKYPVIDLFCGIGGLSHGFRRERFKVIAGFDIDKSCKYAFEQNNQADFYTENLNVLPSDFIASLYPKNATRILIGCAPCQAFSTYSQKYKDNDKWQILYTFGRIVDDIRPEIVSMENVSNLKNYDRGKVLEDFLAVLEKNNYYVNWKIVDSSEYGVPQNRKRLILFASKFGKVEFIKPRYVHRKVTVRDSIGHLPPIEDGETHPSDIIKVLQNYQAKFPKESKLEIKHITEIDQKKFSKII